MELYLSGLIENRTSFSKIISLPLEKLYVLQTFFSIGKNDHLYWSQAKKFMMDSGAFSFMNTRKNVSLFNPLEYTKKYGQYVKEHNISQFLELDVDHIFGIEKYKDCLHCLQDITGREPLRVWHLHRGFDYWKKLVRKFDRVCIGGIAVGDISPENYFIFNILLDEAHRNNCKVHGLGVGSPTSILRYNFDSVDTAGWTGAMKFGNLYRFDGHICKKYEGSSDAPEGYQITRFSTYPKAIEEWTKYSEYLEQF